MIFNCPFECGYNTHHPALCPRGSGSTSPATATSTVNDDEASDEVASLLVVAQPSQANLSVSSASSPSSATPTSTNSHDKTSSMPVSRPPEAPSTEIDLLKPPSARNVVIKISNKRPTQLESSAVAARRRRTTRTTLNELASSQSSSTRSPPWTFSTTPNEIRAIRVNLFNLGLRSPERSSFAKNHRQAVWDRPDQNNSQRVLNIFNFY